MIESTRRSYLSKCMCLGTRCYDFVYSLSYCKYKHKRYIKNRMRGRIMTHEQFLLKYGDFLTECVCVGQSCRECIFKSDKISMPEGQAQCHENMKYASPEETFVIKAYIYENKLDVAQQRADAYGFDLYEALQIGCEVE